MKTVLKILFQIFFGVGLAFILFFSFSFIENKLQLLVTKQCLRSNQRSDMIFCPVRMSTRLEPAVLTIQLVHGGVEDCTCGNPTYIHLDVLTGFFLVYLFGLRAVMKRFGQ